MSQFIPLSLGIDLIEIKKARRLYRDHKGSLGSFFSPREISYIRTGQRPHENLAVLLASKEAVFKAIPRLGTGVAAFRNIEMIPQKENRFSIRLRETAKKVAVKFSILRDKKYVVVQCAGI